MDHSIVLIELIKKYKFEKIAEIGVHKGELTQNILSNVDFIEEYWAIDPWNSNLVDPRTWRGITDKNWEMMYRRVCSLILKYKQLRIIRSISTEASKVFQKRYFDLVYIDGDHYYNAVILDIECWLPLVRKGGILAGHDYGRTHKSQVKEAIDSFFGNNIELREDSVWIYYNG